MIQGYVNSRLGAVVRLRFRGPTGVEQDVHLSLDTGFSSEVTLPGAIINVLGLVQQSRGSGALADGTWISFDVYTADAEWDGHWRSVLVWAVGDDALMGMDLLAGHDLRIAVVPGGDVQITAIP